MTEKDIFTFETHKKKSAEYEPLVFAVIGLAHSHIYGMCHGLINEGAVLKYVYEDDTELLNNFKNVYPNALVCKSEEEILNDDTVKLIACAGIPSERAEIAVKAMKAGKNFFVDKAPVISLSQLEKVKCTVNETGVKYFVYYGESIANESAVFAKQLIERGVIGKVFHIDSLAPHRLNPKSRPDWFFRKANTGGIITDLGSHQAQQFLSYSGNLNATVDFARVNNYNFKEYSEFEDFGDFTLKGDNGVTGYFRFDWNSPAGLKTWGDARMLIEGSEGYIELRKNCNIGYDMNTDFIVVVNNDGMFAHNVSGKIGITYFDDLIFDCYNKTETAMSEKEAFKAIELAITAQEKANIF